MTSKSGDCAARDGKRLSKLRRRLHGKAEIAEIFVVNDGSPVGRRRLCRLDGRAKKNLAVDWRRLGFLAGCWGKHALWQGGTLATSHASDLAEIDRAQLGLNSAAPLRMNHQPVVCFLTTRMRVRTEPAARATADCRTILGRSGVVLAGAVTVAGPKAFYLRFVFEWPKHFSFLPRR